MCMLLRFVSCEVSWHHACYRTNVFSRKQSSETLGGNTFASLGVKSRLTRALQDKGILYPTGIQRQSLPKTLSGRNCVIHSQTGTGKSLTFLIPALQERGTGLSTVVVAPSRELGAQLHYMAERICPNEKRIVSLFSGVDNDLTAHDLRKVKPNILIGTSKRLLQAVEDDVPVFQHVRRLVFDEPDKTFMIMDFEQLKIRHKKLKRQKVRIHPRAGEVLLSKLLHIRKKRIQLICTSATINDTLKGQLTNMGWGENYADISYTAPLAIPEGIKHCYVAANETGGGPNKLDVLVKLFCRSQEKSSLVFIHSQAKIDQFVYELRNRGFTADPLYKHSAGNFSSFMEDFKEGKIQFVVGNEQTVRGLDFNWIQTVYNLVVPERAADYVHLCGRVGRVGKEGTAVTIVDPSVDVQELSRLKMIFEHLQLTTNKLSI